jgi:hypothetical protein
MVNMRNGLYSKLSVIYFLLLTACGDVNISAESDKFDTNYKKEFSSQIKPPNQITVTGKIMLGPVLTGHSLQLVIYDVDKNELARPTVDYDGSYSFVLEDYKGVIFSQVTSVNPDQCSDDYIDEATAKPKCLGKNTILSSTHVQSGTSDNQAKLYTTPVTTVAVLHAGVGLNNNGQLIIPKELTQDDILQSNKAVAKVFGLGDQSIAEYTPTSLITTDKKFQTGDAYTNALAAVSGAEAESKELNTVVKQISAAIKSENNIPYLDPVTQDMMIRGLQEVAEKIKEKSGDNSILENLSNYQNKFPKSVIAVDLIPTLPNSPNFTKQTKTKTSDLKPTWHWQSGGSHSGKYQYRIGETDRTWKPIESNSFTPKSDFKIGQYTLIIREADVDNPNLWSKPSKSTIEILGQLIAPDAKEPENIISNDLPNIISNITSIPPAMEDHDYPLNLLINDNDNETITVKLIDISPLWLTFSNSKEEITLTKNENNLFSVTLSGVPWQEDIGINKFTLRINENKPDEKDFLFEIEVKESTTKFKVELIGTSKQNQTLQFKLINEDQIKQGSFFSHWRTAKSGEGTYKKNYTLTQQDVGQKLFLLYEYIEKDSGEKKVDFAITETVVEDVDEPPQIANLPNLTANIGEIYKFKPNVIDPDADQNFHFTINKVPEWATFNTIDGSLTGTPEIDDIGISKDIVITVTDSTGLIGKTEPFGIEAIKNISTVKTKLKEFNVCWGQKIDAITNEAFSKFKDEVKGILSTSWSKYAMVDFVGWGDCETDDSNETTKITFSNNENIHFSSRYNIINFNAYIVNKLYKPTVIHEFGHLLGLMHEHERYDTYRYGSYKEDKKEKYCENLMPGWPRQLDMEEIDFLEEYKTRLEYDYDPYSIMSYCNRFYYKGKLSLTDIKKVQKKYGARVDSVMSINEKPFTGFYKNGSKNFTYYQDGKLEASDENIVFTIQPNETTEYFNIKHANGMNTLVDYNKKEKWQNKTLIPLSDNAISICKPKSNTANSAQITPLSTCIVFEKKDYVGYRAFYFNSKSNIYNQVIKSFCQELQGDETPWSKSNNWNPKQYFVSLTNCIVISSYFNGDNDWRLYFKGVGYNGRINDLKGYYFIDGLIYEDQYKTEQGVLYKYNFRTQLRSYKNFDNNGQIYKKYTGLYKDNYYIDGLQAESHVLISGFDEDGLPLNDYFALLGNKLYKNGFGFTGINPSKIGKNKRHYIDGSSFEFDGKYEIVNGKTYRFKEEQAHILGYQYNAVFFLELTGFNPTHLGNGKNSYYAQGYPTTILCKSSSNDCTDKDDSVADIYYQFMGLDSNEIYAWIEVVTVYSRYGEALSYSGKPDDVKPILFKGNNPFYGNFDGKKYISGYPE